MGPTESSRVARESTASDSDGGIPSRPKSRPLKPNTWRVPTPCPGCRTPRMSGLARQETATTRHNGEYGKLQTSQAVRSQSETPAVTKPSPSAPTIPDGTPVKLRLGETFLSGTAHVGQTVEFEVLAEANVPPNRLSWNSQRLRATVSATHGRRVSNPGHEAAGK